MFTSTEFDTKSEINSGICDNASDSESEVCDRNEDNLDVEVKYSILKFQSPSGKVNGHRESRFTSDRKCDL